MAAEKNMKKTEDLSFTGIAAQFIVDAGCAVILAGVDALFGSSSAPPKSEAERLQDESRRQNLKDVGEKLDTGEAERLQDESRRQNLKDVGKKLDTVVKNAIGRSTNQYINEAAKHRITANEEKSRLAYFDDDLRLQAQAAQSRAAASFEIACREITKLLEAEGCLVHSVELREKVGKLVMIRIAEIQKEAAEKEQAAAKKKKEEERVREWERTKDEWRRKDEEEQYARDKAQGETKYKQPYRGY
jgi:hypothetical protein